MMDQFLNYIGENLASIAIAAWIAFFLLLLLVLFKIEGMRCEVHKICEKIYAYLDVVFAEEPEAAGAPQPKAEDVLAARQEEAGAAKDERQDAQDAKLLMDVLSEIF